ncbi:TonB family protein [gamma proteobacterium HTCC5015]|nr:TonB family protein [gamma proteobacterium HTCC5015]
MSANALTSTNAVSAGDRLSLTLFLAAALNAVLLLGVVFDQEDQAAIAPPPSLEVILVQDNNKDDNPDQADYLAQTNQDGGGTSEQSDRPSKAFTAVAPNQEKGVAPIPLEAAKPEPQEQNNPIVLTRLHSNHSVDDQPNQETPDTQTQDRRDISELDMQIAQMSAELSAAKEAYAKRPKKLQITARTHAYIAAPYMARWVEKIERIGNMNLPDEARRNELSGELLLEVELRHTGQLVEVKLISSSGHQVLDDAAKRIVALATPFEVFPAKLREQADHIEIVRTWSFSQSGLETR